MPLKKAKEPFQFSTKLELKELTGLRASNLKELLQYLQEVPVSVIYHHTHRYLQQHQFYNPSPPNDFAYWITEVLGLDSLGEELDSINTHEFSSLDDIRQKFATILKNFLNKKQRQRHCAPR